MASNSVLFSLVLVLSILNSQVLALWSCAVDADCSSLSGAVCAAGACACAVGAQAVLGGSLCSPVAPYFTSPCHEDHQCLRLSMQYECRREGSDSEGSCGCQSDHHYFLGRCWPSRDHGETCTRSEECMSVLRNPYNMMCNQTCQCAEGYYQRQNGECRKIGEAVGDGCVVNEDCQFANGICDTSTFSCYDGASDAQSTGETYQQELPAAKASSSLGRVHTTACDASNPCSAPFECTIFGVCVCPNGYYLDESGSDCWAELGSPSTEDQCNGFLAVVRDGICTCPANFFFDDNMRDCVRPTRLITESCVTDANCHTFGAASVCGAPQEPWGLRSCECLTEHAVWDPQRQMCRLFAGVGEFCQVDSDCLAGELEIQCLLNDDGVGYCACPDGLVEFDGLCITSGLDLGDSCQVSLECSETANMACVSGVCACDPNGYSEVDGFCAPTIGGRCDADQDCLIENTICRNGTEDQSLVCQCREEFVEYGEQCWPRVTSIADACTVSAQCQASLGESSACAGGQCACAGGHHYRDGACWPVTGLFQTCSRSSQCFLPGLSERVVCRNSVCQCDFLYPFSEQLWTCTSTSSSTSTSKGSVIGILVLSTMLTQYFI